MFANARENDHTSADPEHCSQNARLEERTVGEPRPGMHWNLTTNRPPGGRARGSDGNGARLTKPGTAHVSVEASEQANEQAHAGHCHHDARAVGQPVGETRAEIHTDLMSARPQGARARRNIGSQAKLTQPSTAQGSVEAPLRKALNPQSEQHLRHAP